MSRHRTSQTKPINKNMERERNTERERRKAKREKKTHLSTPAKSAIKKAQQGHQN